MKRLAMGFGALVLSIQISGCGSSANTGTTMTGPPADLNYANQPAEVREYEARRAAERAKGAMPPRPKAVKP